VGPHHQGGEDRAGMKKARFPGPFS
jgi:hypothetical protein